MVAQIKKVVVLTQTDSISTSESSQLPRALQRIGGLSLIERILLAFQQVKVEHFYIIINTYTVYKKIADAINRNDRLKQLSIHFVSIKQEHNISLSINDIALMDIVGPFYLIKSNYVYGQPTISDFVKQAMKNPTLPILAYDAHSSGITGIDKSANKLQKNEKKYSIDNASSKNSVDMGLYYFPENPGLEIISIIRNNKKVTPAFIKKIFLKDAIWQKIDRPSAKKKAEKKLLQTLSKKTDGWVSRNINRFFSTRISLFLTKFNTSPNAVTTFVFFFTIYGAYLVASGEYANIAIGAFIFQIASILDGCDGELARLTYKGSKFGAWYDTITDNIRYIAFFVALGIASYVNTGWLLYYYATIMVAIVSTYTVITMGRFVWRQGGPLTNLEVTKKVDEQVKASSSSFNRLIGKLRGIDKQDVSAFLLFILCLIGLYQVMFWIAFLGVHIAAIMITKSIRKA